MASHSEWVIEKTEARSKDGVVCAMQPEAAAAGAEILTKHQLPLLAADWSEKNRDVKTLFVVGAGPAAPNPVALLNSERLATFLRSITEPGALADTAGYAPDLTFEQKVTLIETLPGGGYRVHTERPGRLLRRERRVFTARNLSRCFGVALEIEYRQARWAAWAAR